MSDHPVGINLTVLWWWIRLIISLIFMLWCVITLLTTLFWAFFPETINDFPRPFAFAVIGTATMGMIIAALIGLRDAFKAKDRQ